MQWKRWLVRAKLEDYLAPKEQASIIKAIQNAEMQTSGEIRVHLELHCKGDSLTRAAKLFTHFGMQKTAQRNGILIYFALKSRRFALYGDVGIHQVTGEAFWRSLAELVQKQIRSTSQVSSGLCLAIESIGEQLSKHFPRQPDDINELPDEISFEAN